MAAKKKKKGWSRKGHPKLAEAVARVLGGESTIAVADDVGMLAKNLYTAVSRARKKLPKQPKSPKAGIRQGKAVTLAIGEAVKGNGNAKNPHEINISGLRAFAAFEIAREVERQLPAAVAAEMTKRLGRPM